MAEVQEIKRFPFSLSDQQQLRFAASQLTRDQQELYYAASPESPRIDNAPSLLLP